MRLKGWQCLLIGIMIVVAGAGVYFNLVGKSILLGPGCPATLPPLTGVSVSDAERCPQARVWWESPPNPECISQLNFYRDGFFLKSATSLTPNFITDYQNMLSDTTYTYQIGVVNLNGEEDSLSQVASYTTRRCDLVLAEDPEKSLAVILIKFADFPDEPYDTGYVQENMFDGEYSVKAYFDEVSYGNIDVVGDVYGWYELPGNGESYCSWETSGLWFGCDLGDVADDMIPIIENDFDIYSYDEAVIIINGMGTTGIASGWNYFSSQAFNLKGIVHEIGHDYWLQHAGKWVCESDLIGENLDVPSDDTCNQIRYGDKFDPMGARWNHYSTINKGKIGILSPDQIVIAETPGEYVITPTEISGGVKEIRIPVLDATFPKTFYFLDYRTLVGFDALADEFPEFVTGGSAFFNGFQGVILRVNRDRQISSGGIFNGIDTGTLLIPRTNTNPTFSPGNDFYDPYRGISISVLEMDDTHATVNIDFPICGDGIVEIGEKCDDGNQDDTDLCRNDCQTILFDLNGDGYNSIAGDLPFFVNCAFSENCNCPDIGLYSQQCYYSADGNGDGFVSIASDLPLFVDCIFNDIGCYEGGVESAIDPTLNIGGVALLNLYDPLSGVEGMRIVLDPESEGATQTTDTDENGVWNFHDVEAGAYEVRIFCKNQGSQNVRSVKKNSQILVDSFYFFVDENVDLGEVQNFVTIVGSSCEISNAEYVAPKPQFQLEN